MSWSAHPKVFTSLFSIDVGEAFVIIMRDRAIQTYRSKHYTCTQKKLFINTGGADGEEVYRNNDY